MGVATARGESVEKCLWRRREKEEEDEVELRINLQWRRSRERPVRLGMKRRFLEEEEEEENGEDEEPSRVAERNRKSLLQAREERSRVALSIVV